MKVKIKSKDLLMFNIMVTIYSFLFFSAFKMYKEGELWSMILITIIAVFTFLSFAFMYEPKVKITYLK
jgi:hypothetical protein